ARPPPAWRYGLRTTSDRRWTWAPSCSFRPARPGSRCNRPAGSCRVPPQGALEVSSSRAFIGRDLRPRLVRVEGLHRVGDLRRPGAGVLLVRGAVVADDERRDARDRMGRRVRHEGDPADHVPLDDVVVGPTGCLGTLRVQRSIYLDVAVHALAVLGPPAPG